MDPNQNPQTPTPVPQPQQPDEQQQNLQPLPPVAPLQPETTNPVQQQVQQPSLPRQPYAPQPVDQTANTQLETPVTAAVNPNTTIQPPQPMQAPVQPQVSVGQFGAPAVPQQPSGGWKDKFTGARKKLSIIGSVVAVLIFAGIWAINSGIFAKGTALETYEGDEYSILVPSDYEKDTSNPSNVSFTKENGEDESDSEVSISSQSGIREFKDEIKKEFKNTMSESSIQEEIGSDSKIKNYKYDETSINGRDAFVVSADAEKEVDGTPRKGSILYAVIIGDDDMYFVTVFANGNDHGLSKQANKIAESFTIKD